ncbi:hypothetical protein DV515_00002699 [Chloebia gouldiae]|uniref:Uncharacterized protein n=1 Tax=Chloebia gouldiae TaxID=44316 RepID=A0A3L8SVY4_CHLGU|nr:hypothetical protein DV515_00002699 [Chloebia gouldiae]
MCRVGGVELEFICVAAEIIAVQKICAEERLFLLVQEYEINVSIFYPLHVHLNEAKSDDDLIFNKSQFFSSQAKARGSVSRHNFSCSIAINVTAHLIADMSLLIVNSA